MGNPKKNKLLALMIYFDIFMYFSYFNAIGEIVRYTGPYCRAW